MDDTVTSKVARVLWTGKLAALSRLAVLEASRAVSSASMRVRRTSSGVQRWILAVARSSGARARMRASFSRRSPASRSAGNCGAGGGVTGPVAVAVEVVVVVRAVVVRAVVVLTR